MSWKGILRRRVFPAFLALDHLGIHVLPKHYHAPVPDYAWLRTHREAWISRSAMVGIGWDADEQLTWLGEVTRRHIDEVAGLAVYDQLAASGIGGGYGPVESQVLHCVIRALQPRNYLEIGSGVSTACALHAIQMNVADGAERTQVTAIEPYPRPQFETLSGVTHIKALAQDVALDVFGRLGAGDILFIDSSHTVKTGSDVVRIYTEIIPRLPAGVLIHIHDIYLPFQYQRSTLDTFFSWEESVLLQALLVNNGALRVLASLALLHYDRSQPLQALLPDYRPQANDEGLHVREGAPGHFPSSIWLMTGGETVAATP